MVRPVTRLCVSSPLTIAEREDWPLDKLLVRFEALKCSTYLTDARNTSKMTHSRLLAMAHKAMVKVSISVTMVSMSSSVFVRMAHRGKKPSKMVGFPARISSK